MKKFTKISLIAAAGLFIAGCLLGSISVFAGGGVVVRNNDTWAERTIERIGNALYRATDGRLWHAVSERAERETEPSEETKDDVKEQMAGCQEQTGEIRSPSRMSRRLRWSWGREPFIWWKRKRTMA